MPTVTKERNRPSSAMLVTETVPCGVCGGLRYRRLYTEPYRLGAHEVRLGINRCDDCRQVYVSPRLDHESIQRVYALDTQQTISHNYCWSGETSDERFGPLLERLSRIQPTGRLLDIGCGTGNFLAAASLRSQWDLMGIEPSAVAAARAQQRTPARVLPLSLEQTQFPSDHFHIISLLGVLEHLPDPLGTLKQVSRMLHPTGALVVYVPNFHYLRCKDAGPVAWLRYRRWSRLSPQEHLFQFTPSSLRQLLRRAGFEFARLDVGRPFFQRRTWQRWFKQSAFAATTALYRSTGIHIGGLELIAQRAGVAHASKTELRVSA